MKTAFTLDVIEFDNCAESPTRELSGPSQILGAGVGETLTGINFVLSSLHPLNSGFAGFVFDGTHQTRAQGAHVAPDVSGLSGGAPVVELLAARGDATKEVVR
jgi:hypothetical protein